MTGRHRGADTTDGFTMPARLKRWTLSPSARGVALHVHGLCAGYPRHPVFEGLDLELEPGLVHGIIGPNGAGKSTVLKACLGLVPSTGKILVHGHDLAHLTTMQRARLMSYLPQDLATISTLTGEEYVHLGRYACQSRFGGVNLDDDAAVERAIDMTGSREWASRPVAQASGGERQLIALARAIAQDASILMLDEPVSALDLGHELSVLRLLHPWIEDSDGLRTAVLVLHDLTLAARFCDRLYLLVDGRLTASGTPEDVLTARHLSAAYGVDIAVTRVPATGTLAVTPL